MKAEPIIPLGTETPYGTIVAVHTAQGERSYFMQDEDGVVTLIPADLLENDHEG